MATLVPFTNTFGQQVMIDVDSGQVVHDTGDVDVLSEGGAGSPPPPPSSFNPNTARIGDKVPAGDGGYLIYLGPDIYQKPRFQYVSPKTANPTTVVNGKLVDSVTGQVLGDYGTGAGTSITTAGIQAQQAQRALEEQQRQFNEKFGSDKAAFNIRQQLEQQQLAQQAAQAQAQRDFTAQQNQLDRDRQMQQTLLGLGSRPDTLIRYLYALRGQQAPQGLGTPPVLGAPGDVSLQPGRKSPDRSASVAPIIEPSITPQSAPVLTQTAPTLIPQNNKVAGIDLSGAHDPRAMTAPTVGAVSAPTSAPGTIYSPGGAQGTFTPGTGYGQGGMSFTGVQTAAPGNPYFKSAAQMLAEWDPNKPDPNDLVRDPSDFARGGVIPEPVMGVGMMSGRVYTFNEDPSRPETVVPQGKTLADVKDRRPARSPDVEDRDQIPDLNIGPPPPPVEYATYGDEVHPMMPMYVPGMPMQRGGGPYIPSIVAPNGFFAPPSHEMQTYAAGGTIGIDPSVFNPRSISNTFNFPQISNLTGGTSLIPSAQRLFDALPSERNLFSGYLRDEAGVQPEDVFDLARKLAPQATNLRAGRFVN